MKRASRGPLLALVVLATMISGVAEAKGRRTPQATPAAARDAYYSGDVDKALQLAPKAGETA